MINTDWMDNAACIGVNPEVFFPGKGQRDLEARKYCNQCQVRAECLEFAFTIEHTMHGYHHYGIYGGTGPAWRKKVVLERNRRRSDQS
jgi:WhiB family redox-sensing transcriptional regulator